MRIAVDLDGVICPVKSVRESYQDLSPMPGAVERLRALRQAGHYVIILTARSMGTSNSNLGKVVRNIGKLTLDWLERYGVEYDEIYFGKPNAEVYLDDRAIRFSQWSDVTDEVLEREARVR